MLQILPGRGRVDREGMHAAGQFVRQRRIDHTMPLEPALPAKGFRHDIESEMRLAAWPMPGVALVAVRFILDMKALGCESVAQLFRDQIACVHRGWLNRRTRSRSIPTPVHFYRLSSLEGAMSAPA